MRLRAALLTCLLLVLVLGLALGLEARAQSFEPSTLSKQRVTFKSGNLRLVGFLFTPAGAGPFPAVVWNHGSEKNPGAGPQFDAVARIFVPAGYVVFAPVRRGHGDSEGAYIADEIARARQLQGAPAAQREMVRLMETEQLDDQLAGLAYVKRLGFVDATRLVAAGCSYGGIETLLAAERGAGYKAAVAISPAALSWQGNPILQRHSKRRHHQRSDGFIGHGAAPLIPSAAAQLGWMRQRSVFCERARGEPNPGRVRRFRS